MAPRNPGWLMTDERMGDALWPALRRLPPGAGVVFRHYATPPAERRALLRRVRRIANARRLRLVVGGARGGHGRGPRAESWPAHDRREAIAGARAGAGRLFVSPVSATRSHGGAAGIGAMKAARIARGLGEVVALGGMDARGWRRIRALGFDGWAGIDAWIVERRPGLVVRGMPAMNARPGLSGHASMKLSPAAARIRGKGKPDDLDGSH